MGQFLWPPLVIPHRFTLRGNESMSVSIFTNPQWNKDKDHPAYRESVLMPVAPEWTTGEVLLAATYRKLILKVSEKNVDREQISDYLLTKLEPRAMWNDLFTLPGALRSPRPRKDPLPQVMPLVPELARYSGVLGKPRSRWDPGNLLLSTIASGIEREGFDPFVIHLASHLKVEAGDMSTPGDDIFAQYIEEQLRTVSGSPITNDPVRDLSPRAPAWRQPVQPPLIPAERFVKDLRSMLALKKMLTRRQWTVLLEAILRLGLGVHMLWICRLNQIMWDLVLEASEQGLTPDAHEIEKRMWLGHLATDPLLELGQNAGPLLKKQVQMYAHARIGINLALHALDESDPIWGRDCRIGVPTPESLTPSESIASLLRSIAESRSAMSDRLAAVRADTSLRGFAGWVADRNSRFVGGETGVTKNLQEFLRYTLQDLVVADDESISYDQAYIALNSKKGGLVRPGPAALILLVHACCMDQKGMPTSIDDFRNFLSEYGIRAPAGELQNGLTGKDLESLVLVVDSPDAGGGRLLVDPF